MALLFTLLCGSAVLTMGYFSYYFTQGHFSTVTEEIIDGEMKYLTMHSDLSEAPLRSDRMFRLVDSGRQYPVDIPAADEFTEGNVVIFHHADTDKTFAAKQYDYKDNSKLIVGVDITQTRADFNFLLGMSILSIVLMLMVILFSYLISLFVVSGTNRIARTAQAIMHTGDLSQRLNVSSTWDDLGNMSIVLNSMLDRIEQLMLSIKQVSDNIAHDLRTPLTRLKNHLEEIEHNPDSDSIQQVVAETDHILNTFNALLRISRIETAQQKSDFTEVDLKTILGDVISLYEPVMEEKAIQIDLVLCEAKIMGDRNLLFQAFANLLDNAIKFSPQHGNVSMRSYLEDDQIVIFISDDGPGVPASEREKIFQRFYRGESSRTSTGTGLGLSLVKAVVDLHSGSITLTDTDSGTTIRIAFKMNAGFDS